jgi:hypothetical protein
MGRLERRTSQARHKASLRAYRREASNMLLTYLTAPDDPALDSVPILRNTARHWLNDLPGKTRCCIICSSRISDRRKVGALLLSTPVTVNPTLASVCGICRACWELDAPPETLVEILEKASERELQTAIPGGRFLDDADSGSQR